MSRIIFTYRLFVLERSINNLCYWEAPCPIIPRPATEIRKEQPWKGNKKSVEAKTKAEKSTFSVRGRFRLIYLQQRTYRHHVFNHPKTRRQRKRETDRRN